MRSFLWTCSNTYVTVIVLLVILKRSEGLWKIILEGKINLKKRGGKTKDCSSSSRQCGFIVTKRSAETLLHLTNPLGEHLDLSSQDNIKCETNYMTGSGDEILA